MFQLSWCKLEGHIDDYTGLHPLLSSECKNKVLPREPSFTVMSLHVKTHLNHTSGKNEIVIASGIVHTHGK